jgi:hypothetical protein
MAPVSLVSEMVLSSDEHDSKGEHLLLTFQSARSSDHVP